MIDTTGKRVSRVKIAIAKRTVDALEPTAKAWIAWDDKLTGFGVRVYPSGRKSYIVNYRRRVNYRAGDGGRKAPNKRVMLGRFDRILADRARRMAHQVLGNVAGGGDPANERAEARDMPSPDGRRVTKGGSRINRPLQWGIIAPPFSGLKRHTVVPP